jgi:predicted membrane-bound spermidine synthase
MKTAIKHSSGNGSSDRLLHVIECLFFLSGAAALAYQVCWQRILFFSFGTDIESTTIIVSVFMMGLGLGALGGGWAADRWFEKIVLLFALSELGIGIFGFMSPMLLPWVSDIFILSGRGTLAAVNFLLLLLPTALMGATLPMLITLCLKVYRNVGVSTGTLYCLNTLGAATGCALAGVAFKFMTLKAVIAIAACINIFVAATVFAQFRRRL